MLLEKELKLLLNSEGYYNLLLKFNELINPLKQTNYYFDTPDFYLNHLGITLRIREENEAWILCMKSKISNSSSFITSKEIEKTISAHEFLIYKNSPMNILENFSDEFPSLLHYSKINGKIQCLGCIENERRKIFLAEKYIGDLDFTTYPNGSTYYELEIENMVSETDVNNILECLMHSEIDFNINKKSKYKRFVESLQAF